MNKFASKNQFLGTDFKFTHMINKNKILEKNNNALIF